MDIVLLAGGGVQPEDLLYSYTKGKPKAFIDIAGQHMIQWVLDALNGAVGVDNIILVGLDDIRELRCQKPLHLIPNQEGLMANIKAGAERLQELNPRAEYFLLASSDIPAITSEMVDWVIETAKESDHDIHFNVVERAAMEERFPGANRTFAKLNGIEVCGADISVLRLKMVTHNEELWSRLIASRKSVFKQAALIGLDTILMVLFRITDLEGTAQQLSRRVGVNARAIISPYAELAMDVDKPHQLEILIKDLSQKRP